MTRRHYEDVDLLDLVLEKSPAELEALRLDPDTRRRLAEIRRLCELVRAAEGHGQGELSPRAVEAVLARARGGHSLRLSRTPPRLLWAAALLLAAALALLLVLPRKRNVAQAMLFGGIQVEQDGRRFGPEAGPILLVAGMRILADEGGFVRCGETLLAVGKDTRLTCLEADDEVAALRLEEGRLRVERVAAGERLLVWVGSSRLTARSGTAFTIEYRCRPGDALRVDRGQLEVACGGKRVTVRAAEGLYDYRTLCPCSELERQGKVKLCCRDRAAHGGRSFFVTDDPEEALAQARKEGLRVVAIQRRGARLSGLFSGCCVVGFLSRQRRLEGAVWLFLDAVRHRDVIRRWGLENPRAFVVLARDGTVQDRGFLVPKASLLELAERVNGPRSPGKTQADK